MFDKIFLLASKNYLRIIRIFQVFYFVMLVISLAVARILFSKAALFPSAYLLGINSGRLALVSLTIVSLPGIARRFGLKHKLFILLSMFRRHLGITTYMFVFLHVSTTLYVPLLAGQKLNLLSRSLFELMGMGTNVILFSMFLTSNNFSTKRLGVWWKRLHRFVYLAIWLAFLHTYLQRVSIWSVLIGSTAVAEVASFAYQAYKRHKPVSPVSPSSSA